MRMLAAPNDADVARTRKPPMSLSIMTMAPGVIKNSWSSSSFPSTSTRIGKSFDAPIGARRRHRHVFLNRGLPRQIDEHRL
jgi:hypothetical protein